MDIKIPTTRHFNFKRTIVSHGWYGLLPFALDSENWTLTRVIDLEPKPPVTIAMSSGKNHIRVTTSRLLTEAQTAKVIRDARHILRLDDDLQPFYVATAAEPDFDWIGTQGAGRLLRSPTVFEDLVKMICTTNCSWALTEIMVGNLCRKLGTPDGDGRCTFPRPEALAGCTEKYLRSQIRVGYRAPYLLEAARRAASGELDLESWRTPGLPVSELYDRLRTVKGVGPYAAGNILKLLGH